MSVLFAAGWLTLMIGLLLNGRRAIAAVSLFLGFMWLFYAPSLVAWISNLGSDSFSEAQDFDVAEAVDFLKSLKQIVRRESLRTTMLTIAMGLMPAAVVFGVVSWFSRHRGFRVGTSVTMIALVVVVSSVLLQLYPAVSAFKSNSKVFLSIRKNFQTQAQLGIVSAGPVNNLNVVVYIGESTSALNMGIYGYPRPTTPELAKFRTTNENFLTFQNVLSTHVHTMPSLLEALSVGIDATEDTRPIRYRRRVSIIDLLNKAQIPSMLISNQGSAGTWNNLASKVIFGNVSEKVFSFKSAWLGDLDHRANRPLDHQFLIPALDDRGYLRSNGPKVIFLHSYAGHGPYLRFISESYKLPVDDFLAKRSDAIIVGNSLASRGRVVETIEQYDSAIRYIDHVVFSVARQVQESTFPSVLVYFSDHGDAVYAGLRHDSSRFVHEMARVPFVVYFNEAAALKYPKLLNRLRIAALEGKASTLAQLPATLLFLFGLEVEGGSYKGVGIDGPQALSPLLTRETGSGSSYIHIGTHKYPTGGVDGLSDVTDAHTRFFQAARVSQRHATQLCQHDSRTLGQALRGAMVADCLRIELTVGDEELSNHRISPMNLSGIDLGAVIDIAQGYKLPLWIAARDVTSASSCWTLDRLISATSEPEQLDALIMLPAEARWKEPDFRTCIDSLVAKKLTIGLELSPTHIRRCEEELQEYAHDQPRCMELSSLIREVEKSGVFTDLGIDFSSAEIIGQYGVKSELSWNTWNLDLSQLDPNRLTPFRKVAVQLPNDPNAL